MPKPFVIADPDGFNPPDVMRAERVISADPELRNIAEDNGRRCGFASCLFQALVNGRFPTDPFVIELEDMMADAADDVGGPEQNSARLAVFIDGVFDRDATKQRLEEAGVVFARLIGGLSRVAYGISPDVLFAALEVAYGRPLTPELRAEIGAEYATTTSPK